MSVKSIIKSAAVMIAATQCGLTWAAAPGTTAYTCEMEVGLQGQVLEETTMSATLLLEKDGDSMTMRLPQSDATFEVLVQYYRSDKEDDGTANERIQIGINNLQTNEQEDYISSKIKPLLHVTELAGSFKNAQDRVQKFDSITVQCYPEEN
jgi:hypothetical protein